jgi:hypothetical protein
MVFRLRLSFHRLSLGEGGEKRTTALDLFAELVPVLDVAPDADEDINAAIGLRFYF